MMKRLNNQGKVNEPKLDQVLTSEKHGFPISLERLFDPRFCIDPCIKESIDKLHRSESVLRPLLPFNPIVHFQHIKQLLFGLPVSISVSQCQLAPSIALSYTEKSETGEEPAENFAQVVFVSYVIENILSLTLDEELIPVVKVFVQE